MSEPEVSSEVDPVDPLEPFRGIPFAFDGWRHLFFEMLPHLLFVSPDARFFGCGEDHGRIRVECEYVPPSWSPDPDAGFRVFSELMALLELRSESVCQVCGQHGRRYHLNPFSAFALCRVHAIEKGLIDPDDTRIQR